MIVFSLTPIAAQAFIYTDSFDTDTTGVYNWHYLDAKSHYGYDSVNHRVWTTLSDDWPYIRDPETGFITSGKLAIEKQFDIDLVRGHFEYKFYPTRTYPYNGGVLIKLYSSSDPTDSYYFNIGRSSPPRKYGTNLVKTVNGTKVISQMIVPTPPEYSYSLNNWHTISIDFSPTNFTGYLDGQPVLSGSDIGEKEMSVDTMHIYFYQQNQYLDDIYLEGYPHITATVDIEPDTLNLKSNGKWITCYIELPEGQDVSNIAVDSLMLNNQIQANAHPTETDDYDDDGIADLMVKFDRNAVTEILDIGDDVLITIAGELSNGIMFDGSDTIMVISPEK